ncbi:hypothetical protein WBG99_15090 [Streptomyces sp. TG1A-60]|uniref:hypothetical protein n=1 Tax=Streptomyces sp. TG1A-60 TaxID=3129111 RepID=UPI0030CC3865
MALATAMAGMAGAPAATAAEDTSQARAWPGPRILNEPEAKAPQLENTGVWKADPTRVCLSSVYREGEFLYQGCLWDDHGAGPDHEWPVNTLLRTCTYPTDPAYRSNAADLSSCGPGPLPTRPPSASRTTR